MREVSILGDNRFETFTKTRTGCRGIVIKEGKMLLSREENTDWYLIPGGGLEAGETPEQCCQREVEEETGYIVRTGECFLAMNEYYEEYRYVSYYFVCEVVETGSMRLTEQEKKRGLRPLWLPVREAYALFSHHQDYAETSEEKRGSYLREYTALTEYLKRAEV